jgi:outer membrane biosynthesis protein TonB
MAVGLFAVVSLMAGVWARGQSSEQKYHAAGIAQGGDIPYPINTQAPGFVTFDVSVDASGSVQGVNVVRDVPPLTAAAQGAVRGWQFTGAALDDQHVQGTVRVDVAFNPFNPAGVGLPGETLQAPTGGARGKFVPAGLQKANYATYPPNTVAGGTVVLKVAVGKTGKIHGVTALQGAGVLADAASAAAKTWVFAPALYDGKAVGSEVVVVFVFANPAAGTR